MKKASIFACVSMICRSHFYSHENQPSSHPLEIRIRTHILTAYLHNNIERGDVFLFALAGTPTIFLKYRRLVCFLNEFNNLVVGGIQIADITHDGKMVHSRHRRLIQCDWHFIVEINDTELNEVEPHEKRINAHLSETFTQQNESTSIQMAIFRDF